MVSLLFWVVSSMWVFNGCVLKFNVCSSVSRLLLSLK